jgi:FMN phosphatase YigB (HAD superfamily)
MIRAVLFDLDGTLYDRDRLARDLFHAQYAAFAHELRGIAYERFMRDAVAMDDHGYGVKKDGYRALVQTWGLDAALADRLVAHFWASYGGRRPSRGRRRRSARAGLLAVWKFVSYWPPPAAPESPPVIDFLSALLPIVDGA